MRTASYWINRNYIINHGNTMKINDLNYRSLVSLVIVSAVISVVTPVLLYTWVLPHFFDSDSMGWVANLSGSVAAPTDTEMVSHDFRPTDRTVAQANPIPPAAVSQADDPLAERQDTVALTIPPKKSLDYRLAMERDYDLDYTWTANGKTVYSELRGEQKDGKTPSLTFAKLTSTNGKGFFIIPFNGQFGWHWQNKTDQPITIRLHTQGTYQVVGQVGLDTHGNISKTTTDLRARRNPTIGG